MERLDEKLRRLNTIQGYERTEMKNHFLNYSKICSGCKECEYKHHIIEIYELMCVNPKHKPNLRKGDLYKRAEEFVIFNYIADGK